MSSNSGQKLWRRAKDIIPGGSMLLSKQAEMFLPEHWPAYFSKSKGVSVWDMDDNKYTDMLFAVGTNTLGYGHEEIDQAARTVIDQGNMSSWNAPEEVELAEKLIELHPWADMCRFSRSGGEACAIAVRIARAASGKDKVAFCGYHGWHDWYLSANLGDNEKLDDHLLPGLEPKGVPSNLKGSVLPFEYNDLPALEAILKNGETGVIIMEVSRNYQPQSNFLNKVRDLATQYNAVLIFDECTSGFRQTYGGLHLEFNVEPDLAMFGKALGNGYAITAIIGRREVMQAAQSTFISSTFWTERLGPAAAVKTLEVMAREKSWEIITSQGKKIKQAWQQLADAHNLNVEISGLDALATLTFKSENNLTYKTYLTQQLLKQNYLGSNIVYAATVHTDEIIKEYAEKLDQIFASIADCEAGRASTGELLDGPICHSGFKRLN